MLFRNITEPEKYPGIKIYSTMLVSNRSAITLPGLGIFIHPNLSGEIKEMVLQHEYGHFLDFKSLSPHPVLRYIKFYVLIGIPSLLSALFKRWGNHRHYWTEVRANNLALTWFGDNLNSNFLNNYPLK